MQLSLKDIDRFWSKIQVGDKDECWPWIAKSKHPKGYGLFTLSTGKSGGKKIVASRVACTLVNGEAPFPSANTLHSCDNPPCCNPAHLRWGTQKDNVADAIERKRQVNPPNVRDNPEWEARRVAAMPKGENNPNAKLTEAIVREIWRLHFEHKNVSQISEATGAPKALVADICRGRTWRNVEGAPSVEELRLGGVRRGFNQFSKIAPD